jgi:DNA invertase Pin-like site-specific DNA recombinase
MIDIIEFVQKKNLKLILGTFVVDCTSKKMDIMTEALLKVVSVFSELERKMICARVQSGINNAKAKGVILGRKKTAYSDLPDSFFRYLPKYQNKEINKSEFARLTNLSIPSIYKYLEIVQLHT